MGMMTTDEQETIDALKRAGFGDDDISSLMGNIYAKKGYGRELGWRDRGLGFGESAALKMGSQVVPWINQGLTAEDALKLSKMNKIQVANLEKTQGYDKNFKPKAGQKAVSGAKYIAQGAGSLVGQNRVPFGAPFNTNVGGGTAKLQKLLQNPTLKTITSNPYLRKAAMGAGMLGTAGMVLGAFDAGKGVANYAIDKLGVRDDLERVGSNIAKSVQSRKVVAENIKKEKDAGTFKPRVSAIKKRGGSSAAASQRAASIARAKVATSPSSSTYKGGRGSRGSRRFSR